MLLGFKKQFAGPILDGTKIFTIREKRKVEPKIGETLHMYSGLRTKYCEKITSEHKLTGVSSIKMVVSDGKIAILINNKGLNRFEQKVFTTCDGFTNRQSFIDFWLKDVKPNKFGTRMIVKEDLVIYHWTDFRF